MTNAVHVSQHPIVATKLALLRDTSQPPKVVRELMHDLSQLLGYEASANLPLSSDKQTLSQRVGLVPVLRSGLGLVDGFLGLFPDAPVLHLGLYREKVTLQPVEYYNKLPNCPHVDMCFVLDPMIATGGTAIATVNILKEWGIPGPSIKLVAVVASTPGLSNFRMEHPDVDIHVAAIDDRLDDHGYVCPGLGDSGDRLWNTSSPVK